MGKFLEDNDFGYGGDGKTFFDVSVNVPDWKIKELKRFARKLGFSCRKKGMWVVGVGILKAMVFPRAIASHKSGEK